MGEHPVTCQLPELNVGSPRQPALYPPCLPAENPYKVSAAAAGGWFPGGNRFHQGMLRLMCGNRYRFSEDPGPCHCENRTSLTTPIGSNEDVPSESRTYARWLSPHPQCERSGTAEGHRVTGFRATGNVNYLRGHGRNEGHRCGGRTCSENDRRV